MQANIQILSDQIINRIAAGEVIESPVSVVKELVENAIDAKSKNIIIEIKQAGYQIVKVEDDGIGMNEKDAVLCFTNHGTSKIKDFDDLQTLSSMGFRGEALASIASISLVDLKTSQDNVATHVKIDAGKIQQVEPIARTKGTSIEVKSLFYNVPVRKKFQKTQSYVISEITKYVIRLALANPEIGFKFISNDKTIIEVDSQNLDFDEAIKIRTKTLLNEKFLSSCIEINFEKAPVKIKGFIGLPNFSKKTRSDQYLLVNRRVITSHVISRFIKDAYATKISDDDHPIFVLHINMPPSFVDVNVHPQKKQIRLREEIFLKDVIKKAIDNSFENIFSKPSIENKRSFKSYNFTNQESYENYDVDNEKFRSLEKQLLFEDSYEIRPKISEFYIFSHFLLIDAKNITILNIEDKDSLVAVDLKAANACILYDEISNEETQKQMLLFPHTIEIAPHQLLLIESNLDPFAKLGFDLRIIGNTTISIDSIPQTMDENDIEDLFLSILKDLNEKNRSLNEKKLAQDLCKIAKSKKKYFAKNEAINILEKLLTLEQPYFDPLGNPTIVQWTSGEFEKVFQQKGK